MAGLLNPVPYSVGWDRILPAELVRRDVFLQHLSQYPSLAGITYVLMVDGGLSETEKSQYQSSLGAGWPNSLYKDDVDV